MPNRYEAVMNKRSVRIIQTLRGELAKPVVQNGMNAAGRNGGTVLQSGLIRNYFDSAGTTAATVDNPVGLVQDSVGSNNATQATVGSKPTLRRDANGRYYWQFDPAAPGDYLQTAITTGNEGWVCAGVTPTQVTTATTVFNAGATSDTVKGVWLYANAGSWVFRVGNGTARADPGALTASAGVPVVVSGGWTASTVTLDKDGVSVSAARSGDCTSPSAALIGAISGGALALNGGISVTIICPTLPPSADRALIRAWVAKQQGQTL